MYFYKENIVEKEETRQIVYYQNNDIVLTNYKYTRKKLNKNVVNDKYENIKDDKNKLNHYTTNLKNIANI